MLLWSNDITRTNIKYCSLNGRKVSVDETKGHNMMAANKIRCFNLLLLLNQRVNKIAMNNINKDDALS